nr:hypothetical protein [uncultured Prevotella sp.]
MKMKYQNLWALPVLALFTLASCSNDDTAQENNGKQKGTPAGMTEFAVKEEASTRTMGVYSGSGIDFFWTQGDKLWINNAASLIQSSDDDITGKAATAKFYFTGTYNEQSYSVRYTGKGNNTGDKVTIQSEQEQTTPNDGSHIGTDGDCGTATATRKGAGRYEFTLSHKASYITFIPYYSHEFSEDVKVTQIKVTADEVLAGKFDFDDNGLKRTSVSDPKTSITLKLNGGDTNGFPIPTSSTYAKNAAIMVLAPGTYHNFTVEYRLYDQKTLVEGTVTKNYGELTFHEGKNKKVAADLTVPHYSSDIYYMWDAVKGQHVWKNNESYQPILNEGVDSHYPKSASDARWYNPVNYPTSASRSAAKCPNANEFLWYLKYGDPHWDSSIWEIMKHLYTGGMWLKKRSVIATEQHKTLQDLKKAAPDDFDFTSASATNFDKYIKDNTSIKLDKPAKSFDYIFLPAFGYYIKDGENGKLKNVGNSVYYWSSTPRPYNNGNAYNLLIQKDKVHVGYGDRANAFCLWPE